MNFRRHAAAAALLVGGFTVPLQAQVDTLTPRPLFTQNDWWLAAAFVGGTIVLHPLDKHMATRLQDTTVQENRFFGDAATGFRLMGEPGAEIIGVSMYAVGRLTHVGRAADLGLHGTEAIALGGLTGDVLKMLFGRARPYVDTQPNPNDWQFGRGLKGGNYQSFPSGHTIAAFAAAAAVSDETSRWWPQTRWIIGPAMYGGAAMVGLSRMYNNKHWASDVMLGAAIGTFAGNKVVRYHHSHPGNPIDRIFLNGSLVPTGAHRYSLVWSLLPR